MLFIPSSWLSDKLHYYLNAKTGKKVNTVYQRVTMATGLETWERLYLAAISKSRFITICFRSVRKLIGLLTQSWLHGVNLIAADWQKPLLKAALPPLWISESRLTQRTKTRTVTLTVTDGVSGHWRLFVLVYSFILIFCFWLRMPD